MRQLETGSTPGFLLVPANAPDRVAFMPLGRELTPPHAGLAGHDWRGEAPGAPSSGPGLGLLPWQAKRVRDYVDTSLHSRISLGMAATQARLSPGYFSRCFRRSFGVTFSRFVASRRVERAQDLMTRSTETLCQVAQTCGFADQAHFSRTFGGLVGCSPSQWRRQFAPPGARIEI